MLLVPFPSNCFLGCVCLLAAPCNKILAQPGTITGSIGVIFLKLNVKEALQEYGITGDTVSFGDNADWASGLHTLTPKQQQQVSLRLQEAVVAGFSVCLEAHWRPHVMSVGHILRLRVNHLRGHLAVAVCVLLANFVCSASALRLLAAGLHSEPHRMPLAISPLLSPAPSVAPPHQRKDALPVQCVHGVAH